MAGNVWEYVEYADRRRQFCVLRGGSYTNNQYEVRSYLRLFDVPRDHRAPDFGFRCAQVIQAPAAGPAKKAKKKSMKKK
jgi:formylglycine-generating enzyme required for sulfatase activity